MKQSLLLILLTCFVVQSVEAGMRYSPFYNVVYTYPFDPSINQDEYRALVDACFDADYRIKLANQMRGDKKGLSKKQMLSQLTHFLKSVGTPAALRLIEDLKADAMHYDDGTFMKKLFA